MFHRIFIGPFEITLYEYSYEVTVELIEPILLQPDPPLDIATLNKGTGDLVLTTSKGPFLCTKLGGSLGEEEIECLAGTPKWKRRIRSFEPVKTISTDGDLTGDGGECEFQGIESESTFKRVDHLILDYSGTQHGEILISGSKVQAGPAAIVNWNSLGKGTIKLPTKPEVPLLVTTFSDCNHAWTLVGHTNIKIKGSEIKSSCNITAAGGEFNDARLIIDFSDLVEDCSDSENSVVLKADETTDEVVAVITNKDHKVTLRIGSVFTSVEIYMSPCDDHVSVESTLESSGYVIVDTRGGDDAVSIGQNKSGLFGLDKIHKKITVDGSLGDDTLIIWDQSSVKDKLNGTLSSYKVSGLMGPYKNETIFYKGFESMSVDLSGGVNIFNISSTAPGAVVFIQAQSKDDTILVYDTQGDLEVRGGGGDDTFFFYGMGDNTTSEIYGEVGNDVLWVDGTGNASILSNTFDNTTIRWSGGKDNDTINTVFASTGTSNIDLFDDIHGSNSLNIQCANFACFVLSR